MTALALWQYAIFAILVAALIVALSAMALVAADRAVLRRQRAHDMSNEMVLIKGNLDFVLQTMPDPPRRLRDVQDSVATVCALLGNDNGAPTRIRMRRFVRAMVKRVCPTNGEAIEYDDSADPRVEVISLELRRLLTNALLNALQARESSGSKDPVRVDLAAEHITITNPANKRDCSMVQQRNGSTKGNGRGVGKGSILRSAKRLGWAVRYTVEASSVILTLRWHEDGCYHEEGVTDVPPEQRPN